MDREGCRGAGSSCPDPGSLLGILSSNSFTLSFCTAIWRTVPDRCCFALGGVKGKSGAVTGHGRDERIQQESRQKERTIRVLLVAILVYIVSGQRCRTRTCAFFTTGHAALHDTYPVLMAADRKEKGFHS